MAGLTWREGRIVLALVALCTLCQASQAPNYKCFPFSATSQGTIEPTGDIIREVGTSYEASCLFDPNQVRADEVFFMRWGKTPKDQYRIQHKVVNDSAISIQVMHEEATEYKLRCLTGNTTFLCERTVKFGYLPQDVKNFTCISKNWNKLNCSWTAPENPVTVRYQLTYVVLGFLDSRECPKSQKGINWCYWGESDFNDRDMWVMKLTAINQLNQKGVQFERRISVFENVLPDPPVELVAKVNGPYEVNVTWKLPHPIDVFIGGVVHEVSYRERHDGDEPDDVSWILVEQRRVNPDRFKKETFSRVITNLHAYIRYDFRVRLHTGTGPIRQSMWSDAAIRTERTAATRPTVAPLTDIGTFEIEETLSHRDIYINWQIVDPLFWNGPNFYYNVSVFEVQTNRPVSHEVDIRDAYAKFSNMDKDVAYRFEIIPMNDEGPPGNDLKSVVVVPEMTAILKPINYFKVFAYGDSNNIYSLRWRLPESQQENQKIKSLTLYWCKKDKYEERCQNKLEWVTVEDLNITSKNLTDLENSSLYMFGISVNSNNSSSGIKWHTCIASHGSRPPPLEQFEMTHVSPTEVNLKWILDCRAKAAEPTGFNISYCKAAESLDSCPLETGMTYETVSDETTLEHLVKNLHPYTNYIFNIAILTEMGLSKWSRSLSVRTMADKPSGSPRLLEARAVGQEWVLLAWEPPLDEERNGKITKYIVSSEQTGKPTSVMANNTSNVTMYNVTDLEPFTNYTFNVTACSQGLRSVLCGEAAASLHVRTRIGTPGRIESIDQEDQQLEWEHDECNAPECSYELHYRMNGTEHQYISAPGQLAANFKDMNITCTEHQEEININIRAINIDEDGKQLTGPWKEKKITCHIPGSYRYDRVPSISINLHTVLVQLPPSNQYSTIFNFLRIPYVGNQQNPLLNTYSLVQAQGPVLNDGLRGMNMEQIVPDTVNIRQTLVGNRVNDKKWSFNSNGVPVTSRDVAIQPVEEGNKRRYNAWYANRIGGNNKQQVNAAYNREELHTINGIGNPFLLNRNAGQLDNMNSIDNNNIIDNYTPLKGSIQSSLSSTAPLPPYNFDSSLSSKNRVLLEDSNPTDLMPQDKHKAYQVLYHQKNPSTARQFNEHKAKYQDITRQEIPDYSKIGNSNANCPLIELMKAKGVEVNFSTSSDGFKLNIKGHGEFHDLLQSIYHHAHVREGVSGGSEIEHVIKNSVANVSMGGDAEADVESMIDSDALEQHTLERSQNYAVTVPENQTVRNISLIHSHTIAEDQTHAVKETSPINVFHENSSAIVASHYTSMEKKAHTTSASSVKETVELIGNRSQVLGDLHSESESNSTVTPVVLQDDVGNGTGVVHSHESPETLSVGPIQAVPNSRLSLTDFLQGRHSSLYTLTSQNMDESSGADTRVEVMNGNTNEVLLDNEKRNIVIVKETVEEPQTSDNSKEKGMEGQQIMETSWPTASASIIYHLQFMGSSFNGDVDNIVPHLTNKRTIPIAHSPSEEINEVSVSNNTISRLNLKPIINGEEPDKNTFVNAKGQHNTHRQSECPFRGLLEAKNIKMYINTSENGGFEFKFQGNESLYSLVGKIFHSGNAILDNAEEGSVEEESVSLNHLVHGDAKSPQPVLKILANDSTSTNLAAEEILANNSRLATSVIIDGPSVDQSSVNKTDGVYVQAEYTAEELHSTEEQTRGQVITEATVLASTSHVLLSEYTTDIENLSETYTMGTETTSDEVTLSPVTSDFLESNYSTHTRSSHSEYWTHNSIQSQTSEEVNSTRPGDQSLTPESTGVSMTTNSHPLEDDGTTSTGTPWLQNEAETILHHEEQSESTLSASPSVGPNTEAVPPKS